VLIKKKIVSSDWFRLVMSGWTPQKYTGQEWILFEYDDLIHEGMNNMGGKAVMRV